MKRAKRLDELAARYELDRGSAETFAALLTALAAEPDPHTTVSDPARAIDAHVADSLSGLEIRQLREAETIADLGAGAGFPGLVLAAALPDAQVDLVESAARKVAVIERLAAAASLRVGALPVRAEELAAGEGREAYGAVTARAVASLPVLVEYAAPLLRLGGVFVAWKGERDATEESAGAAAASVVGLEPAGIVPVVPFRAARNRHLHVYLKVLDTPERFPRRPGMAAKRPLA